ncbi:hypothetical protein COV53_04905 [Candidatus Gottesmanbacteria bacterium CG11_big_fil_rev_8_21_14_0_20_37_11]|uniref:Uncharacterized protein n=2 Tax=Candidatus Gottesmaniibacteriota TaxID=1752720 RepID=A0A2M7RSW2_9BACT|nr:MAG: hypothetical protein COX23_03125 [Candidatus Gottesmanbacteria bacterium CG23_combo_of_CG06-09_8_20_14_all_37_19]PIR08083.1 MAG: hypothetical protein COV53_04905 [Candidatus Gottesmanbacteria bacterium CG11_big_fil_rev_8_21_14_0_20_37_11]PIZ03320.1 MAG: hypothetical protein COY59_00165 [Candidatus Gottesmanbacteria bacterium CG_4_10_14_0_8_um_filter_37_24]
MKLKKFLIFIFILPLTLFLDLIIYGMVKTCPTCGSFSQWIQTEGALSFPIVVGISEWFGQMIRTQQNNKYD